MSARAARLALLLGLAALAAAPAAPPPQMLDVLLPSGRITVTPDALAAQYPLAQGLDFQVSELGRDAHTSHHLVWIAQAEVPHRHDLHDLFVVMLRGHGTMRLGAETRTVGPGSALYVPRATAHAFTNESGAPALAYAVYLPPFNGTDRVPLDAPPR